MDNLLTASNGETFAFKKGITDHEIDQLIEYAKTDETVRNFTSDPKRFASRESFDNWRKDGTVFYTLTDKENNLAGIIWLEELPLPEFEPQKNNQINNIDPNNYHITFAIRTYGSARGKSLSTPFTQKAFQDSGVKNVWLSTSPDNIPGISSYKKSGFIELGMRKDEQKLIMILPKI